MSDDNTPSLPSMSRWRRVYYVIPIIALIIPFVANEYLLWVVNAILVYVLVTVGFNIIIGNLGQLALMLRAQFLTDVVQLNKMRGTPFRASEIESKIIELTETH